MSVTARRVRPAPAPDPKQPRRMRVLGPGLITGASDDVKAPQQGPDAIQRIRLDTYIGMAFANLVALAIIVTTAATLNASGITDISTSSEAAEALRPVAGPFAFTLFALGIVGTGLL